MSSLEKEIPIKVSGNIISEFSDKVPSYIFAINEILKNSYDACATQINIKYDEKKHTLEIIDNGTGISLDNLSSLFHISKSSKVYGRSICDNKRLEQGEKGLGLLAVFKFGNSIRWITKHTSYNKPIEFQVNKQQLISENNITDHRILYTESTTELAKGTRLIISNFNESEKTVINNFFSNKANISKISNLFLDKNIQITYYLNSNAQKNPSLPEIIKANKAPERFNAFFDSETQELKFNKSKKLIKIVKFSESCPAGMTIKTKLKILNLKNSSKQNVNEIFHDPIDGALKPLVFVNGVWFNNFNLFIPEITRKISGSRTLPQIIGYLTINTTQSQIQFNADRTEFIENNASLELREYLKSLNIFIQKQGIIIKDAQPNHEDKEQEGNTIQPELDLNHTTSEQDESEFEWQTDHESSEDEYKSLVNIKLKQLVKNINFYQSSATFDLYELIDEFTVEGNPKRNTELEIHLDNIKLENNNLSSIKETTTKILQFRYSLNSIDYYSDEIKLNFTKKSPKLTSKVKTPPLVQSFSFDYVIDLPIVGTLIEQINDLWSENKKYKVIIATSLRVIFELTTKYFFDRTRETSNSNKLEDNVVNIISLVFDYNQDNNSGNPNFYKRITKEYSNFRNVYNQPNDFRHKVLKSNLGSHGAIDNLTTDDIESIAKYAGYYAQLVDAYLKEKKEGV